MKICVHPQHVAGLLDRADQDLAHPGHEERRDDQDGGRGRGCSSVPRSS